MTGNQAIGQLTLAHQIASAQFDRLDTEPSRSKIQNALDPVDGFWAPCAAIGSGRRRVGQHGLYGDGSDRHAVGTGRNTIAGRRGNRNAKGCGIGPEACMVNDAQRHYPKPLVKADFDLGGMISRMIVGEETLHPLSAPADRPAVAARRVKHQAILGIGRDPATESATDVAHPDPYTLARDTKHVIRQNRSSMVRGLTGTTQCPGRLDCVVETDGSARLHGMRNEPVVSHPEAKAVPRPGKGAIAKCLITHAQFGHDIPRTAVLHKGRT